MFNVRSACGLVHLPVYLIVSEKEGSITSPLTEKRVEKRMQLEQPPLSPAAIIVKPENICTPPVGAVSNRTEFGVKLITESTIIPFSGGYWQVRRIADSPRAGSQ